MEAFALPHRHDLDGISALVVPIHPLMSHSTNLGDTRIAFGDKMCQAFSSNVHEASIYPPIQQQMTSAVQCIGTAVNDRPNISPCEQNLFHRRRPNESVKVWSLWHATNAVGQKSLAPLGLTSGNDTTFRRGFFRKFLQIEVKYPSFQLDEATFPLDDEEGEKTFPLMCFGAKRKGR